MNGNAAPGAGGFSRFSSWYLKNASSPAVRYTAWASCRSNSAVVETATTSFCSIGYGIVISTFGAVSAHQSNLHKNNDPFTVSFAVIFGGFSVATQVDLGRIFRQVEVLGGQGEGPARIWFGVRRNRSGVGDRALRSEQCDQLPGVSLQCAERVPASLVGRKLSVTSATGSHSANPNQLLGNSARTLSQSLCGRRCNSPMANSLLQPPVLHCGLLHNSCNR